MNKLLISALITTSALTLFAPLASAEHREGGDRRGEWHGDIRGFEHHDLGHWRDGRWRHGWHDGRIGWWWVLGGIWYFYPAPVYPYPDPYTPPIVVQSQPPVVVIQPPPVMAAPQAPQTWYYCEPSRAYYPYVSTCPSGWKAVPAAPPGAPQ